MNRNSFLASSVAAGMVTTFPKIALSKEPHLHKIIQPYFEFYEGNGYFIYLGSNKENHFAYSACYHNVGNIPLESDVWDVLSQTSWKGKPIFKLKIHDDKLLAAHWMQPYSSGVIRKWFAFNWGSYYDKNWRDENRKMWKRLGYGAFGEENISGVDKMYDPHILEKFPSFVKEFITNTKLEIT